MSTGAESRYKLSRSQKFILVQKFDCSQMRVSGFKSHLNLSYVQERFAKTVTNQLTFIVRVSKSCVSWVVAGYEEFKSSLKQQRNCRHDYSQGILALSMGNEPVSYKTDQLEVSQNKEMSKGFEIGLSVKMFRHIDQTALWCSLFKSWVLLASRLMTESPEKVWIYSVLVWVEELNESKPLLKCRK